MGGKTMVALILLAGALTVAVATVEGGEEMVMWISRKWQDHKLFKRNRREMRMYY